MFFLHSVCLNAHWFFFLFYCIFTMNLLIYSTLWRFESCCISFSSRFLQHCKLHSHDLQKMVKFINWWFISRWNWRKYVMCECFPLHLVNDMHALVGKTDQKEILSLHVFIRPRCSTQWNGNKCVLFFMTSFTLISFWLDNYTT